MKHTHGIPVKRYCNDFHLWFYYSCKSLPNCLTCHDDVMKWKFFPRYWPFVWGIHWWLVNSPHKGQWGRALMFSLICAWINGWVNNCEAGDLRRHHAHYDVTLPVKSPEALTAEIDCFPRSVLAFTVLIKISADNSPLNQLPVKFFFFSLIIKTFRH